MLHLKCLPVLESTYSDINNDSECYALFYFDIVMLTKLNDYAVTCIILIMQVKKARNGIKIGILLLSMPEDF